MGSTDDLLFVAVVAVRGGFTRAAAAAARRVSSFRSVNQLPAFASRRGRAVGTGSPGAVLEPAPSGCTSSPQQAQPNKHASAGGQQSDDFYAGSRASTAPVAKMVAVWFPRSTTNRSGAAELTAPPTGRATEPRQPVAVTHQVSGQAVQRMANRPHLQRFQAGVPRRPPQGPHCQPPPRPGKGPTVGARASG